MSNYSQITDFSAKDALSTGDANKKIVGAHIDAELSAISAAIASKLEEVSQAAVTAHQAALSIAETQIPDGSVLARVAANETISGTWTFSNFPTFTGATVWRNTNDGAGSGLDADLLDGQDGAYFLNCVNFTGSLADARLSSNVPLKNGTNAFTGACTFTSLGNSTVTGTLTKSSKGGFPYYDSSTQSGGAITVSTSDASGTPGAGDLWFKYTA